MAGKYNIPPLTSTNWAVWKPKVVGLLESKGMHDALTDQAYADTSKALGLIKLYMDSSMLSMMHGTHYRTSLQRTQQQMQCS
jgi:hypothetical protein